MKARSLTMDDKCQQCVVCQCTVVHPCTQWLDFPAKGLGIETETRFWYWEPKLRSISVS